MRYEELDYKQRCEHLERELAIAYRLLRAIYHWAAKRFILDRVLLQNSTIGAALRFGYNGSFEGSAWFENKPKEELTKVLRDELS